MKTPVKVSTKVQRRELLELFLGCQSRTSITFRCIFAGWDHLWFFLAEVRDTTSAIPVRVHRKYHISMYFLRKVISHFLPNEKISCFREKNTVFPDNTRKIMSQRGPFWKDHLFRKFEENIIFPCIFLRKIIFHFPSKV